MKIGELKLLLVMSLLALSGTGVACREVQSQSSDQQPGTPAAVTPPSAVAPQSAEPKEQRGTPARRFDFSNFTFPFTAGLTEPGKRSGHFTLSEGESPEDEDRIGMYLAHVAYGDVTGDGEEEAIVRIGVHTGGSSMSNVVYIYGFTADGRPKLLWTFETGDRADGGFRNAYGDQGQLIVELYGKDLYIGKDLYSGDNAITGACGPSHYTRARYAWDGKRFKMVGRPETLPNPEGHGSPVDFKST